MAISSTTLALHACLGQAAALRSSSTTVLIAANAFLPGGALGSCATNVLATSCSARPLVSKITDRETASGETAGSLLNCKPAIHPPMKVETMQVPMLLNPNSLLLGTINLCLRPCTQGQAVPDQDPELCTGGFISEVMTLMLVSELEKPPTQGPGRDVMMSTFVTGSLWMSPSTPLLRPFAAELYALNFSRLGSS